MSSVTVILGQAAPPTSPHRAKDSKERTNERAQFINFRLQQVKGHNVASWTKRLGSGAMVVERGGDRRIRASNATDRVKGEMLRIQEKPKVGAELNKS
jgi:hypothetical protein